MTDKVSPELRAQLDSSRKEPLQAVLQLRFPDQPTTAPSPEQFCEMANAVLERVKSTVGHPAARTHILRNIASLIVEADPEFLEALIQQPEVISALPNRTAESLLIPPHGKSPA